jgi:hypothetical protein
MNRLAMTTALLAALTGSASARAEQATLQIEGIQSPADAAVVTEVLRSVSAVTVATAPTQEKPIALIKFDPQKADVGDLARATAGAKTANHEKMPPTTTLVLRYARLDANALSDEVYLPGRVEPVFAKLRGVEASKCKLDTRQKQILLRLDPKAGARLAEIKKAFPGLSVQ